MNSDLDQLILDLYDIEAIKFGEFELKSGLISPIYMDIRLIVSYPKILKSIAKIMWSKVCKIEFDIICGVPYTALPIATVMSTQNNKPMIMRRKEVKKYGTKKIIEGKFESKQTCLVVEDLVTSGSSIFETLEPIEDVGLIVKDIIILIDREQGGKNHIENKGYKLHSIAKISEILKVLKKYEKIDTNTFNKVNKFIKENQV